MKDNAKPLYKRNLSNYNEFPLIVIIIVLFALFTFVTHSFFTQYNLTNVLKQCSIIGIIAIGELYVIIAGGIDLSPGSICGLSSLAMAMLSTYGKMPISVSIIIAILIGVVCGLYNGIIIYDFHVPPFIATLGSMTIIRGLIEVISNAQTIANLNKTFTDFSSNITLAIPNLTWVWIAVIAIAFFILKYTAFGRNVYVIGCNPEVAKLSGINLRLNTYAIYSFAGLLYGIGGVLLTSRISSALPESGTGYEMSAITAVVVGGASLQGGKGSIAGVVIGTLLIELINNGGNQFGINPFIMDILTGILITVAVIIDQFRNHKK
jgi:ribose transport system permease protein